MNGILMVGLIASYLGFVALGLPSVDFGMLGASKWSAALIGLPVIFTSFSYQGIIPSLTAYLHRDAKQVRIAIVAGTSMAFVIYLIWEFLILGIVPVQGEFGLEWARQMGQTAVAPLRYHVASNAVAAIGQGFAFFAIATSFLGVTLGLLDFLADGLRVAKKGWRRVGLSLLTFVPPAIVAWVNPHLFISALIFAGGIGCALLLGLLPVLMVWRARYGSGGLYQEEELLGGGKPMLVILIVFVVVELFFEFKHLII
jgi:tyrosine-specific transport protein